MHRDSRFVFGGSVHPAQSTAFMFKWADDGRFAYVDVRFGGNAHVTASHLYSVTTDDKIIADVRWNMSENGRNRAFGFVEGASKVLLLASLLATLIAGLVRGEDSLYVSLFGTLVCVFASWFFLRPITIGTRTGQLLFPCAARKGRRVRRTAKVAASLAVAVLLGFSGWSVWRMVFTPSLKVVSPINMTSMRTMVKDLNDIVNEIDTLGRTGELTGADIRRASEALGRESPALFSINFMV